MHLREPESLMEHGSSKTKSMFKDQVSSKAQVNNQYPPISVSKPNNQARYNSLGLSYERHLGGEVAR